MIILTVQGLRVQRFTVCVFIKKRISKGGIVPIIKKLERSEIINDDRLQKKRNGF